MDAYKDAAAVQAAACEALLRSAHELLVRLGAGARCAEFVPAACCAAL
jgi:hypothetical protein